MKAMSSLEKVSLLDVNLHTYTDVFRNRSPKFQSDCACCKVLIVSINLRRMRGCCNVLACIHAHTYSRVLHVQMHTKGTDFWQTQEITRFWPVPVMLLTWLHVKRRMGCIYTYTYICCQRSLEYSHTRALCAYFVCVPHVVSHTRALCAYYVCVPHVVSHTRALCAYFVCRPHAQRIGMPHLFVV